MANGRWETGKPIATRDGAESRAPGGRSGCFGIGGLEVLEEAGEGFLVGGVVPLAEIAADFA